MTNLLSRLRPKCRLFGCDGSPYCERCGTDLYDSADYIQYGLLEPLFDLAWRVRRLFRPHKRCGKAMGKESCCVRVAGHQGDCDDIPF
jgi:hypothetical protein